MEQFCVIYNWFLSLRDIQIPFLDFRTVSLTGLTTCFGVAGSISKFLKMLAIVAFISNIANF